MVEMFEISPRRLRPFLARQRLPSPTSADLIRRSTWTELAPNCRISSNASVK